jgi:hypothetical protein
MTMRSEIPFDLVGVNQKVSVTCECGKTFACNFRTDYKLIVMGLPLIACDCGVQRDMLVGRAIEAARAALAADRPPKGVYISDRRVQAIEGPDGRMIPNMNAQRRRRAHG